MRRLRKNAFLCVTLDLVMAPQRYYRTHVFHTQATSSHMQFVQAYEQINTLVRTSVGVEASEQSGCPLPKAANSTDEWESRKCVTQLDVGIENRCALCHAIYIQNRLDVLQLLFVLCVRCRPIRSIATAVVYFQRYFAFEAFDDEPHSFVRCVVASFLTGSSLNFVI